MSPFSTTPPSEAGPAEAPPLVPDHEVYPRVIGQGAYGSIFLARNVMGTWRAVKAVYRRHFDSDRTYEREWEAIRQFEPVSRTHASQVSILHIGRNDDAGYFYYVMELADDAAPAARPRTRCPAWRFPPSPLTPALTSRARWPTS